MSLHKLPQSYFEAVGRIEFIQSNWYLEGRSRELMIRVTDTLSFLAPKMYELDNSHWKACENICSILEGLDVAYQSISTSDRRFELMLDQFFDHLDKIRLSIGFCPPEGEQIDDY